jgi:hypothetical protein
VAHVRELARMSLASKHTPTPARSKRKSATAVLSKLESFSGAAALRSGKRPDSRQVEREAQVDLRKKRDELSRMGEARRARAAQLQKLRDQHEELATQQAAKEEAAAAGGGQKKLTLLSSKHDTILTDTEHLLWYGGTLNVLAVRARASRVEAELRLTVAKVRKTPSWPRSWANFSLL